MGAAPAGTRRMSPATIPWLWISSRVRVVPSAESHLPDGPSCLKRARGASPAISELAGTREAQTPAPCRSWGA